MTSKIYHIYAKGKCIAHSVPENEFKGVWETAKHLVGLMKTEYEINDLDYEEVTNTLSKDDISY